MNVGRRTRIKICGIRDIETAKAAAQLGVGFIGLVRVDHSARWVSRETAGLICRAIGGRAECVLVLSNGSRDEAMDWTGIVQLHGDEQAETWGSLPRIIKAIAAAEIESPLNREWLGQPNVKAILLDSSRPGSGTAVDCDVLERAYRVVGAPVIVAGGLHPGNVGDVIRRFRPFGVDVSSGVETVPGEKSVDLIRQFCEAVRTADSEG